MGQADNLGFLIKCTDNDVPSLCDSPANKLYLIVRKRQKIQTKGHATK